LQSSAEVDHQPIRDRLDDGVRDGEIGFEAANLRHAVEGASTGSRPESGG